MAYPAATKNRRQRIKTRPHGDRSLMTLSEADTRAKLIDPALHARGWTEDNQTEFRIFVGVLRNSLDRELR